jgi:hypothetical protein
MKKLVIPFLFAFLVPLSYSCSNAGRLYSLTEADAAAAIRQMLEIGTRQNMTGAFSKDMIMAAIFPENVRKTLNTLQQLGLTSEIDRFTTTLATASERAATSSVPVFVNAINRMSFTDAVRIIKNGGTSATDYLRSQAGTELRQSIRPHMQTALDEYKLNEAWSRIMKPAQTVLGDRFNLDLANLMAGMVSEKMFQQMEEQERQVRNSASARTTPLLQKVFSRNWN